MQIRIIGIDLAISAKNKAIVLDQASNSFVSRLLTFQPYPAELDRLLNCARAGADGEVHLVAVLEATGMAWYPVGVYFHQRGVTVYRVNGKKTKELRKVYWSQTGSDSIDARVLARLFQLAPERLCPWSPPDGAQLALQRACREFDRWRRLDVSIQNRLISFDQWAWNGLHKLVPAAAQPWMRRHWYDPWQVCKFGVSHLSNAWETVAPKLPADTRWIPAWVERANMMTHLFGSPDMVGYQFLQDTICRQLDLLEQARQHRDQLQKTIIIPLFRQLYPDCPLKTISGIGEISAAFYMAFIQDINRFNNVAEFRKWCGIIPASSQSGDAESKGLSLTKTGPNLIKATLYQNAQVARLWDVQIAAIYYNQMVNLGKHFHQAICACASHLASRIFVVLKEQRPYQFCDLENQPISKAQSRKLVKSQYHVPEDVRQRNNKRARRQRREDRSEELYQRRQKR
ncbi:MAG: IS110 family transposase [Anaerolineales bacterium]|nr:IS110 family transposase [Anaerolineales bacterium]